MTGPEHYKQAEKLIAALGDLRDTMRDAEIAEASSCALAINGVIAEAQVHATLALAAATVVVGGLTEANTSAFDIPRHPSWAKAVQSS